MIVAPAGPAVGPVAAALIADALPVTTSPSPAFYVALVLYGVVSLLYMSAFTTAPRWVERVARIGLLLAFVAHGVDIGWRGVLGVHPGTSVREALGFLSWLMVGGYLLATLRYRLSMLGAFVAPVAMVILAAARLSTSGPAVAGLNQLGRIHVSLATIGVALFGLATGVAIMYLLEERNLKRKRFDRPLFKRGAALETLDRLSHRLVLFGFPIFTLAIMLGVIWGAERSESFLRIEYLLAVIAWATFAALIVSRTRGVRGRRAAVLTIVGFAAVVLVLAIYFVRRAVGG